jgi:signal transduction histidine kinase
MVHCSSAGRAPEDPIARHAFDRARGADPTVELRGVAPEHREVARRAVRMAASAPGPACVVWRHPRGGEAVWVAHNAPYGRLFAGRPILGRTLAEHAPGLVPTWSAALEKALGGAGAAVAPVPFEVEEEGRQGREHLGVTWLPIHVGGLDGRDDDVPVGAIGVLHDVTPTVERLRRLVGSVAHDLRDPLVAIRLVAQQIGRLARRDGAPGTEARVGETERIVGLTERMNRLIGQIGDFAKLAGGEGLRLDPRPCDLAVVVRSICDELRAQDPGPLTVTATEMYGLWDGDAVRRLVTNLVTNARRYGPSGGVITVALEHLESGVLLEVYDEGTGIRDDEAAKLFEPWQRGDALAAGGATASVAPAHAGAGLGLFIFREIVTAHGGHIGCDRLEPRGFVMRVRLPLSRSGVFPSV